MTAYHHCDRCGRNIGTGFYTALKIERRHAINGRDTELTPEFFNPYTADLCAECSERFEKFMNEGMPHYDVRDILYHDGEPLPDDVEVTGSPWMGGMMGT